MTTTQVIAAKERFIFDKPRARGWLHLYAFFAAAVCGVVLSALALARPGWAPLIAIAIYCVTICGLFGVSALYHRRWWTHRGWKMMRRLDHSMIFVFIAGTYTPFSVLLLPKDTSTKILSIVWTGALLGVILKMAWPSSPAWLGVPLYIALGWVAVFALPTFLSVGGVTVLVLLAVGGAAYTIGGLLYALKRPNPWPATFGHHEFFHACTLVAALCHHIAVYFALYA